MGVISDAIESTFSRFMTVRTRCLRRPPRGDGARAGVWLVRRTIEACAWMLALTGVPHRCYSLFFPSGASGVLQYGTPTEGAVPLSPLNATWSLS